MTGDWKDRAACKGQDISMFFPGTGGPKTNAVDYCRVCPVSGPCLQEALQSRRVHGIWGGTTQRERALIIGSK